MGMGMLFAGALTGGAKAVNDLVDQAYKREDEDRKRQTTVMDRRNELLFEMQAKSEWAQREEEATAAAFERVAERGAQIGSERGARELEAARSTVPNEGEFANERITPEMMASMPPEARAIYERDMGLTDDSALQGLRDQVTASRETAAPASVRKGLLDSYNAEVKTEKAKRDEEFKERREEQRGEEARRRLEQGDKRLDQQWTLSQQNLAVAQQRADAYGQRSGGAGPGGGIDQTEKLTVLKDVKAKADATKPRRSDYRSDAKYDAALGAWNASGDGQMSAEAARRIMSVFGSGAETASTARLGVPSSAAPVSAKKDNQSTSGAPIKVQGKAQYDALPNGTRYVAPDGSIRIKG